MRLAIVHDWLNTLGGAERVLIELHQMFPEAPIYVLFYNKKFVRQHLPDTDIRASFLQRVPFITKLYSLSSFLMPVAVESFDLSGYDTVLSSSVTFSKGLVLKPSTRHICYCYSPTRFLWDRNRSDQLSITDFQWGRELFKHFLRLWDVSAADRVDQFVAISKTVHGRIKKYYGKESVVIYPPATDLTLSSTVRSRAGEQERDFYLIVSRLYDYKNIDVAIKAFNKLGYLLVIIGDGPARSKLKRMARKNIRFLGEQSDQVVAAHYAACKALIMPQEEDFGLTALEAMGFGKPVIALRKGGATETVVEDVTGEFFDDSIPEGIGDAVTRFQAKTHDPETIKRRAAEFSSERFRQSIFKLLQG